MQVNARYSLDPHREVQIFKYWYSFSKQFGLKGIVPAVFGSAGAMHPNRWRKQFRGGQAPLLSLFLFCKWAGESRDPQFNGLI